MQALEENLEQANAESLMKAEQPCDETMHAKDQYMATLEKEKGDLQTELNKWVNVAIRNRGSDMSCLLRSAVLI